MEIKGIDPIEIAGLASTGDINALEAYIILKELAGKTELALKQIQNDALTEASKYPEKSFSAFGAKIELRNGASTFKFSQSVSDMETELKKIKDMAKLGSFVYEPTGEVIDQAVKIEGKSTLAVSFV